MPGEDIYTCVFYSPPPASSPYWRKLGYTYNPFSVHSACRFQVVFMACSTLTSSCFHGVCRLKVSVISSFRRFQTSFDNVLCPDFLFSSRVSLSSFLFQPGLFMVFSEPNLVFVLCVTFSLVFGLFCSYLFSMSLLLLGSFFMVCRFFCPHVGRVILVLYFTFSILCGPCFFCMRAPSHIL